MEKEDIISQAFSRYLTGFCLSKAILEDYAKVIGKLGDIPEQEIKDRIWKRTDEIFKEVMEKQMQQASEQNNDNHN
ncbi:MAG TPA: hypothetical protein VK484_11540 [Ferruginibacter sp.]|nr:hypothetical protein [Ferruginibacter sp.]